MGDSSVCQVRCVAGRQQSALDLAPGVDLGRRGEEAEPTSHSNNVAVTNLAVGAPWNDLKEIAVGSERWSRKRAQLRSRQGRQSYRVVLAIELDLKVRIGRTRSRETLAWIMFRHLMSRGRLCAARRFGCSPVAVRFAWTQRDPLSRWTNGTFSV
jgi:hypothetical protein